MDYKKIAVTYGIDDNIDCLKEALLGIKGVKEVNFDLNGYLDDIYQVIIIVKYGIEPVDWTSDLYYKERKKMLNKILRFARIAGLKRTEDSIEDMGEHYYLVFNSSKWDDNKEFALFYSHAGRDIPVGSEGWVPTRRIANKLMEYYESRPLFKEDRIFMKSRERQREYEPVKQRFNNKPVYNSDYCYWNALRAGDYVAEEVADDFLNCMSAASDRANCLQLGEPADTRIDENGNARNVFLTLKKIEHGIWQYCGKCFRGENVERGTMPSYS